MTTFRLSGATKTSFQEAWRWMFQGFFPSEQLHSLSLLVIEDHVGVLWALCGTGVPFIQYVGTTTWEGFPGADRLRFTEELWRTCSTFDELLLVAPAASCPAEPGPSEKHTAISHETLLLYVTWPINVSLSIAVCKICLQIAQNTNSCDHRNFFWDMWEVFFWNWDF